MADDWKTSTFLTEMMAYVNYLDTKLVGAAQRAGNAQPPIQLRSYYDAVWGGAISKKTGNKLPKNWSIASGPVRAPNINSYLGGSQPSGYLIARGNKTGEYAPSKNPFADPWFVQMFLYFYSDRKILGGSMSKVSSTRPDGFNVEKKKSSRKRSKQNDNIWQETDYNHYVSVCQKITIQDYAPYNQAYGYHRYGFFTDPKHVEVTRGGGKLSNLFLKDRMAPQLFSGAPETDTLGLVGCVNLHRKLMEHIKAEDPQFKNEGLRHCFLLAGGKHFGRNDISHLNIMDAVKYKGRYTIYEFVPDDVIEFWKDNHKTAVRIESGSTTTDNTVLAQLETLLGERVTLDLFAKYITHGAPKSAEFRKKIYHYTHRGVWDVTNQIRRPPIVSATLDNIDKGEAFLTLVFPDYIYSGWYYSTAKENKADFETVKYENEEEFRRSIPSGVRDSGKAYNIGLSNMGSAKNIKPTQTDEYELRYDGNYPGNFGSKGGKALLATGRKNSIKFSKNSQILNVVKRSLYVAPDDDKAVVEMTKKAVASEIEVQRGGKRRDKPLVWFKKGQWENRAGGRVSISTKYVSPPNFEPTKENETYTKKKIYGSIVGKPPDIPKDRSLLDFDPTGKDISKYADALGNAVEDELGSETVTGLIGKSALKNIVTSAGQIKVPYDKTLMTGIYGGLLDAQKVIEKEYKRLEKRAKYLEDQLTAAPAGEEKWDEITKKILLSGQSETDKEAVSLQLWIDSVNSAANKVAQWMQCAVTSANAFVAFFAINVLDKGEKSDDEINKLTRDLYRGNLRSTKGLRARSKIPFDIKLPPPPETPDPGLSDDEIKKRLDERKKNIDQCLVSGNIEKLAEAYNKKIKAELAGSGFTIHRASIDGSVKKVPFGGRFFLVSDSKAQHSKISNYILANKGENLRPFLDITTDLMSALTPKIRLYRVSTDSNGVDKETEFVFENFVSGREARGLRDGTKFEKGRGCGIKSFTFTYEGGTPATAKKDINAELVLYFQSFNELTKFRGTSGRKYKYIDLLLYPNNQAGVADSGNIHPNQYNPQNFRIRADVGWNLRQDFAMAEMVTKRISQTDQNKLRESNAGKRGIKKIQKEFEEQEVTLSDDDAFNRYLLKRFNKAVELQNKSLLLNMIDHDIDFRNDGSVEIKITYAAYIESATRSAKCNAISTPQIEAFASRQNNEIEKLLAEGKCTIREINALKQARQATYRDYVLAAQGSIVNRLLDRGLTRTAVFNKKDVDEYLKDFATLPPAPKGNITLSQTASGSKEVEVGFYFLGDIIHTVMDCLFDLTTKLPEKYDPQTDQLKEYTKRRKDLAKFVPLLSSFVYTDYNKKEPYFTSNIAEIPISVKFFNEWLVNNVSKNERIVYPLMDFIRDLAKAVVDLITDACINRQFDVSLFFQTAEIRARKNPFLYDPKSSAKSKTTWKDIVKDVDTMHKNGDLPLYTSDTINGGRISLNRYHDFSLLYPVSPVLSSGHKGVGMRSQDEKLGTYHFQIGSNKGLLKNVKFSKTDMAFLREARYFNQGNYGLLQLGAVYNVNLELFGNTLFYPGMEIFIDPRGFGGTSWDPTVGGKNRSVANALGIGGYHVITKVQSTISPSGFTTSLDAVFQFSGDKSQRNVAVDGSTVRMKEPKITESSGKKSGKCATALDTFLSRRAKASAKRKSKKKKKRLKKGK